MLLMEKLQNCKHLSASQRAVVDFLMEHKETVETMTMEDIAKSVYTSPATLVRLSKNLGYTGFNQLKRDFIEEQKYLSQHFRSIDANLPFQERENMMSIAGKISSLVKETMDDTLSLLNYQDLAAAVNIIEKADKIHLSAISFPLLMGQNFQLKMRRVGKCVEITDLVGEQLYTASIIHKNDCGLIISYSGETPVPCDMMRLYKKKKIPVIAITSMGSNYIRDHADVSLTITSREKLYSKIAGYSSEFSIKLILDILYSCYFRNHYTEFLSSKKELSKASEPGRVSNSNILKEDS